MMSLSAVISTNPGEVSPRLRRAWTPTITEVEGQAGNKLSLRICSVFVRGSVQAGVTGPTAAYNCRHWEKSRTFQVAMWYLQGICGQKQHRVHIMQEIVPLQLCKSGYEEVA